MWVIRLDDGSFISQHRKGSKTVIGMPDNYGIHRRFWSNPDINKARTYARKCDASNSIRFIGQGTPFKITAFPGEIENFAYVSAGNRDLIVFRMKKGAPGWQFDALCDMMNEVSNKTGCMSVVLPYDIKVASLSEEVRKEIAQAYLEGLGEDG